MPQLIAFAAFGTTNIAGLTVAGITLGTATGGLTLAGSILSLGGSLLLSSAAAALSAPSQQDQLRELNYPDALLPQRFVYGETLAVGSPIGYPVKGAYIYGCWLLNSRPSEGDFRLFLNKREALFTGDPYDFTMSGGALASQWPFEDHTKFWIGRGDQTTVPAQILAEAPWVASSAENLFLPTDVGRGLTILWARFRNGDNSQRQERWPTRPPLIEVQGKFSKVWDMRDVTQDPSDPATWEWSENQALCLLDAYRTNPIAPYEDRNLMLRLWEEAADIADIDVPKKAGGTQKQFVLSGTMVFDGAELENLTAPLWLAGAARPVQVGGRLGIVPGAWATPVYELTDILGDIQFDKTSDPNDTPNEILTTYTSAARSYAKAELSPWKIPGALAADGGVPNVSRIDLGWVPNGIQAQRVRNILGRQKRLQKKMTTIAPPDAFVCIGGSVITVNLPAPYVFMNGTARVVQCEPGADAVGVNGGVALRLPVTIQEDAPSVYAFDPATDEEDIEDPVYSGAAQGVSPPGAISVTTGPSVAQDLGEIRVDRIKLEAAPSETSPIDDYELQYQQDGGDWQPGGTVPAGDGVANVVGYITRINPVSIYGARLRAWSGGAASEWVEVLGISSFFVLDAVSAEALPGRIEVTATGPNTDAFQGVEIVRSDIGDALELGAAVGDVISMSKDVATTVVVGDTLGQNVLQNGDFSDDTVHTHPAANGLWAVEAGNWVISGGVASHTPGTETGILRQNFAALETGETYRITYEITGDDNDSALGVRFRLLTASSFYDPFTPAVHLGNGLYQVEFVAQAFTVGVALRCASGWTGQVPHAFVVRARAASLALGRSDFFVRPVTKTGTRGPAVGPFTLTIP